MITQEDILITSRIKTALEQSQGASNAIHIAAQIAAAHRLSAYAPDRITPEARQSAIDAYGAVTGEAPWEDGIEAALLAAFAAFAVLGGA